MKSKQPQRAAPRAGDALLITPKLGNRVLTHVIVLAIRELADVLRHEPASYGYRFTSDRKGVVFSEPAPRPLIDLVAELIEVGQEPVRLEQLADLEPVFALSPSGLRVFVKPEDERIGPAAGSWDSIAVH